MHSRYVAQNSPYSHDHAAFLSPVFRMLLSAVFLMWPTSQARAQARAPQEIKSLPTAAPQVSHIRGDSKDVYELVLQPNELFQVHVVQIGVNVLLRLLDASGREAAQMQSPHQFQSGETLTFVAPEPGSYRLEVTALNPQAAPGKYTIIREAPRAATARDRRRVAVERVFVEAVTAWYIKEQQQAAVEKLDEALAGWGEVADAPMADLTRRLGLSSKAYIAFAEGRKQLSKDPREALKKFAEARGFYHELGDARREAIALMGMREAAILMNDEKAGIEYLKQAFPLFTRPEERSTKSDVLAEIAKYYLFKEKDERAAATYLLLLHPIYKDLGQWRDVALVASAIGGLHSRLGDNEKAYEYLHEALSLRKHFADKCHELELLTNIGKVALELGLKAEALRYLQNEAPPLYESTGCPASRPLARNNLGKTYYDLGDLEKARDAYKTALAEQAEDGFKAIIHNNLGTVRYSLGEYAEALDSYHSALALYRADAKAQATTLTNIAVAHAAQGSRRLAFARFRDALALEQAAGDRNGEAVTLMRRSEVYLKAGDKVAAWGDAHRALSLLGAVNDPSSEAVALANAANVARWQGDRRLAIFYGKMAVNKFQELRGAARGASGELQINYLQTVKGAFQHLAELLIEDGQIEHAVQVLNLHQDQQFFDLNLDPRAPVGLALLSTRESTLADRYESQRQKLRQLWRRLAELESEAGGLDARRLRVELAAADEAFSAMLGAASKELSGPAAGEGKQQSVEDVDKLRRALAKLADTPEHRAAALYTLAGDETFYVLMLTHDSAQAFSHPTRARAVGAKVAELLTALSCPDFDPFRESAAVYDLILKSVAADGRTTLEVALEKHKPDLLLWSLGDRLDRVPMAALYDARRKEFLVERYQNTVFTRARPDRLSREPGPWLEGIGLGNTKGVTGFGPIPGVKQSLTTIFGDPEAGREGLIEGPIRLDGEFTQAALEGLDGKWPLVHISTHFAYYPGNAESSALLLGDGKWFSLSEMQRHGDLFAGVELLMLSACQTAVQRTNFYGKKIDGFAEVAQRIGAYSVIATLWNVSDEDAPLKEAGFYRLRRDNPGWSKSEVLRQTQLSLLRGHEGRGASGQTRQALFGGQAQKRAGCAADAGTARKRFRLDPRAPLSHPYYWAGFVLYGAPR